MLWPSLAHEIVWAGARSPCCLTKNMGLYGPIHWDYNNPSGKFCSPTSRWGSFGWRIDILNTVREEMRDQAPMVQTLLISCGPKIKQSQTRCFTGLQRTPSFFDLWLSHELFLGWFHIPVEVTHWLQGTLWCHQIWWWCLWRDRMRPRENVCFSVVLILKTT